VLDGKIYSKGMLGFKADIGRALAALDFVGDPEAYDRREQLVAMEIACDAAILFRRAPRGARRAEWRGTEDEAAPGRAAPHRAVCRRVPAHAPRDFHEALQAYWFLPPWRRHRAERLGRVQPGHPTSTCFLSIGAGSSTDAHGKQQRAELLECFIVK